MIVASRATTWHLTHGGKRGHKPVSDTVWHDDPEVSRDFRSDRAGILPQGQNTAQKAACQSPQSGGGDPGLTGRKCGSVPNFLTPTQRHNSLPSKGADPLGQRVAWTETATRCAHLSWKNVFLFLWWVGKMTLTGFFHAAASETQLTPPLLLSCLSSLSGISP